MNNFSEVRTDAGSTLRPTLTPESLNTLLKITAPTDAVTVKGIASEVYYWRKPGETRASRIYGRLGGLGEASIRFELQPFATISDGDAVVLHGALRIKPFEALRTTHEVILVGDVVGGWAPGNSLQVDGQTKTALEPLVRQRPRMTLESAIARHGLDAVAFLTSATGWQDLTNAGQDASQIGNCRQFTTNFAQPDKFLESLANVCSDPTIKVLMIARGGGDNGLAIIGNSHAVAAALLASGRAFYTALGHDKDVLLLDKHADQAFATPSVLGQAVAEAQRANLEKANLLKRVQVLSQSVETLTRQNAELSSTAKLQTAPPEPVSRKRYLMWGVVLSIAVFVMSKCSG